MQTPFGYWLAGDIPDKYKVEFRPDMPFFQVTDPKVDGPDGVVYIHHDKVDHFGTASRIPVGQETRSSKGGK